MTARFRSIHGAGLKPSRLANEQGRTTQSYSRIGFATNEQMVAHWDWRQRAHRASRHALCGFPAILRSRLAFAGLLPIARCITKHDSRRSGRALPHYLVPQWNASSTYAELNPCHRLYCSTNEREIQSTGFLSVAFQPRDPCCAALANSRCKCVRDIMKSAARARLST